jgi:lipid-A-disaccharide synthase
MSMHCALAGIPGAVVYRANPLTYLLGKMLVKVKYIGISNLLLNEPMYPEFIQHAATPTALAADLRQAIHDPHRRARTFEQSVRLRAMLGDERAGTAAGWLGRQLDSAS